MPENKTQSQPKQREERIDVKLGVPVSFAPQLAGVLGVSTGEEETPSTPAGQDIDLSQFNPEDIEIAKQAMEARGMRMPQGVNLPGGAPVSRPPQPAGQQGLPKFTGGGGGLPSQQEAFEYAMQPPPPVQTKKEFMAGQKSPEWWRIMLADFAGGAPGAGRAEWEAKADKAYQEAIQAQMQDRAEFERKQGLVGQYAVKPGDEMVKFKFGDREIEIERKNTGQLAGMFAKEYDAALDKDKNIKLKDLLPGDINAPDWTLPRDKALAYANFFIGQKEKGLGTGRDLLRTVNPELWEFLEEHDFKQAERLARAKKDIQDEVTQRAPTEFENQRELNSMYQTDDYGNPTYVAPQLAGYLENITRGQGEVENIDKFGYAENLAMMNHTRYKNEKGDRSPLYDYYKKKLDNDGWYFMGERIPNNEKKARQKLRVLRDRNKINQVQSSAFMQTHFGTWNRDFEVQPIDPAWFDPEAAGVEKVSRVAAPKVGKTAKAMVGPDVSSALEMAKRTQEAGPAPLKENQVTESTVKKYISARGLDWAQGVAAFEAAGKDIVMGR